MKLTKLVFLIASVLLFTNCEKADPIEEIKKEQEDPKPDPKEDGTITYFTLNRSIASPDEENWLVIHNQDGELLDYKKFERGDSLVFEALESQLENTEELTITILNSDVGPNNGIHSINTYTGIDKGSVWDQKAESANGISGKMGNDSGLLRFKPGRKLTQKRGANYNIVVNNIPEIERYTISSGGSSIAGSQIHQYTTTLHVNDIELNLDDEYLLSIEDGEGKMNYLFLSVPEVSGDINLDYSDFLEYDHVLEVSLPEHYHLNAYVWGYEAEVFSGTSLLLSSQGSGGPSDPIARFGFIDDYGAFDTYFAIETLDDYGYGYEELGKIPDTIAVMEKPDFTLHDNNIEGFKFVTDVNYLRRFSFWEFRETLPDNTVNQTQWRLQSPYGNSVKIGSLPQEIIENYEYLNLDKLNYSKTDFVLKGRTYEDVLNSVFNRITVWPPKYEWVTFYNPEN